MRNARCWALDCWNIQGILRACCINLIQSLCCWIDWRKSLLLPSHSSQMWNLSMLSLLARLFFIASLYKLHHLVILLVFFVVQMRFQVPSGIVFWSKVLTWCVLFVPGREQARLPSRLLFGFSCLFFLKRLKQFAIRLCVPSVANVSKDSVISASSALITFSVGHATKPANTKITPLSDSLPL